MKLVEMLEKTIPIFSREKVSGDFVEHLSKLIPGEQCQINLERLNIILTTWNLPSAKEQFFNYYFGDNVTDIEILRCGLTKFIKDALWYYGDIERAYKALCKVDSVESIIRNRQFDHNEFTKRLPWNLLNNIPPAERGYLGYVSGDRPFREKDSLSIAETVCKAIQDHRSILSDMTRDDLESKVMEIIGHEREEIDNAKRRVKEIRGLESMDLFSTSELNENQDKIETIRSRIRTEIDHIDELRKTGEQNLVEYMRIIDSIDVYIATSMRDDRQYIEMAEFVNDVFTNELIAPLNLRYFDPTLSYCKSRLDKGIIECLLVRTAKVTIYCAQNDDTFGKDSELASTLTQGKPAIVFVPMGDPSKIIRKYDSTGLISEVSESELLERRANTFQKFHPLSLQVGLTDGVARGVIVVRTPEQCARILEKTLHNQIEVDISQEESGLVLRERETKSVIRIMTGWGKLAGTFWNHFSQTSAARGGYYSD